MLILLELANYKDSSTGRGFLLVSCQSRNRPDPTTIAEPPSSANVGTSPQKKKPRAADHTSIK
jgi:hypothetical protein